MESPVGRPHVQDRKRTQGGLESVTAEFLQEMGPKGICLQTGRCKRLTSRLGLSLGRVNGQDRNVNYCLVEMRVGGQVVPKGLQS